MNNKMKEDFPYEFDLNYDLKTLSATIEKLRKLKTDLQSIKKDYSDIHRKLREYGYRLPDDLKHFIE